MYEWSLSIEHRPVSDETEIQPPGVFTSV